MKKKNNEDVFTIMDIDWNPNATNYFPKPPEKTSLIEVSNICWLKIISRNQLTTYCKITEFSIQFEVGVFKDIYIKICFVLAMQRQMARAKHCRI